MTSDEFESMLYPNAARRTGVSRRRLLASSAVAGAAAAAGCTGTDSQTPSESGTAPTVFVFNTGDGTVTLIDPDRDEVVGSSSLGLSASFPSNQFTPTLTTAPTDAVWLNVDRGVRALSAGSLSETAAVETGSGANWLEQTPDGAHVIVSAREPAHRQFRIDAATDSDSFGEVTAEIDRMPEDGRGDRDGPGPCDVTVHPDGGYAYVPDLFGDTLTVLSVDPFEIETQVDVEPAGDGPARPWMATAAPDGQRLLVEHSEGDTGTESIWDISDPATPTELTRLTAADGLGERPLTSEIGPDSETGYVFTPGSDAVTVVDLTDESVVDTLALGGSAFVGTWDPDRTKLYVPVQTSDEVAVIDHERRAIVERIPVGPSPYGATAVRVRPDTGSDSAAALSVAAARLGVAGGSPETTYCIGNCDCGHEL